jgi:lipoyl-dependent peroxiredoxin
LLAGDNGVFKKLNILQRSFIMAIRTADAVWQGDLKGGKGNVKFGNGAFDGQYSFSSRFEEGMGTNPEELIAAAHASCYSMALSHGLAQAGHTPTEVRTTANVHLEKGDAGFSVPKIDLVTVAKVPGIDEAAFQEQAKKAKDNCPISKLLAAAEITLDAKLES